MAADERHKRAGDGPGRLEDITEHHRHWQEQIYDVFIQRNTLALETEPTPYTAGRQRNVTIPSDDALTECVDIDHATLIDALIE